MEGVSIMKLVKGKKYEVIKDLFGGVRPGEIVVALGEESVSYFVELSHYKKEYLTWMNTLLKTFVYYHY
jgi:hypothetical protein